MCSVQTWFHDKRIGCVVECRACNKMHVCFGNIMATLSSNDFGGFQRQIRTTVDYHVPRDNKHAKDIMMQTPYTGFSIILSETELFDLHYMIEQADNERKAAQLLQLFEV